MPTATPAFTSLLRRSSSASFRSFSAIVCSLAPQIWRLFGLGSVRLMPPRSNISRCWKASRREAVDPASTPRCQRFGGHRQDAGADRPRAESAAVGRAPETILCLTFTKAAAAEMANRIGARLAAWVRLPDNDLRKDLFALRAAEHPAIAWSARGGCSPRCWKRPAACASRPSTASRRPCLRPSRRRRGSRRGSSRSRAALSRSWADHARQLARGRRGGRRTKRLIARRAMPQPAARGRRRGRLSDALREGAGGARRARRAGQHRGASARDDGAAG